MSKLLDKLSTSSTVKGSSVLTQSEFFGKADQVATEVPIINLALSGNVDGGLTPGHTVLAGPSKHFKTNLGLAAVSAYLKSDPEAVCLYYDSEFGSPPGYLKQFGIDTDRILHTPVANVEQLRTDVSNQLEEIDRGDKVIIFIDSIGNLASKKEVDDAISGSTAADMTRAKVIKSLFRIVTPYLTMKNIPMISVNHTYNTMEMFSKQVVSGGTGVMLSADTVLIIGREQVKGSDNKTVIGYKFKINVEKSRFVKEKTTLPFTASFEDGIDKWSGLLELAVEMGYVERPNKQKYTRPTVENDKEWKRTETSCKEFWKPILDDTDFKDALHDRVALGEVEMISEDEEYIKD